MKIKTLVAMLIAGFFATSLAYADATSGSQKFADESMDNSQQMQQNSDSSGSGGNPQSGSSSQDNSSGSMDNQSSTDTGGSSDEGNADTTTGDEDY